MNKFITSLTIILITATFYCSSDSKDKDSQNDKSATLSDLQITEQDNCVYLKWKCVGCNNSEFVIIRDTEYNNRVTKKVSEKTDKTEYLDCNILKGLTYHYTVVLSDSDSKSIQGKIITAPLKDFSIKADTERYTGKKFEITLEYEPKASNPFDMTELDITMEIIKPDGTKDEARGFFMIEYQIEKDENGSERFIKGKDRIRVRYIPDISGTYITKFTIRDKGNTFYSGYYPFEVKNLKKREFIRVSEKNPMYFATENDDFFIPVGFNIGWARNNGLFEFQHYIDRMAEANANLFRMWMIKWSNAIEWTKGNGSGDYNGLMSYAQDNAARLDSILSYAEEKGIKIMLTLGSYLEFTEGGHWNEGAWKENPYNIINGGMCSAPEEFFTNEEAKRIYKNRLKYISARWGYSDSIFAYEFFNETNAPYEWVSEMANYLKKIDYSRHLISTTYGDEKIFSLKSIDFTMMHLYGNPPDLIRDYPKRVNEITSQFTVKYRKPFLLAEFGIDWSKSDYEYDKEGSAINFHNGIFSAISSGSAGTAMLWWWDDYIDRLNLYSVLTSVRKVIDEFGDFDGVGPIKTENINYDQSRLNIFGLRSERRILLWIQNKESSWYNDYNNVEFQSVSGDIVINNLNINCSATIKILNPWDGNILRDFVIDISRTMSYYIDDLKRDIFLIGKCR